MKKKIIILVICTLLVIFLLGVVFFNKNKKSDKDEYVEAGYVYLKYSLEDDTHSDTGYNFPFAVKAYITENSEIIGNLQKEKIVKVQYENSNVPLDELKIKSIEVIED